MMTTAERLSWFLFSRLSGYTYVNNCSDIQDGINGINEIIEYLTACMSHSLPIWGESINRGNDIFDQCTIWLRSESPLTNEYRNQLGSLATFKYLAYCKKNIEPI